MMKQEFEKLIGKEVEYETFEMYEKMYNAVDVDKQTFVKMLNIKAIPEKKRDELSQAEHDELIKDIKDEIKRNQNDIEALDEDIKRYKEYVEISQDEADKWYWEDKIKSYKASQKSKRAVIESLKSMLSMLA